MGMAVCFLAYSVLTRILPLGTDPLQPKDVTGYSLAIAAGIGAMVALVVSYRRQRDLEQGLFVERFGAAAKQLGDPDAAVRIAGVYAMAGVADESSGPKRQQCVDVLCGYLRLPYSPELGDNHQQKLVITNPAKPDGSMDELHFQYRQNDKEVRQTIVRVITAHLQTGVEYSWSRCDYDFTGVHFEDADFRSAVFSGGFTRFTNATFSGATTGFDKATFSGNRAIFGGATFGGDETSFYEATFSGTATWFVGATFSAAETWFTRATFSAAETWFTGATFISTDISFNAATFSSNETNFSGATFSGDQINFYEATFRGERTTFEEATFSGNQTSFPWVTFSGKLTNFFGTTFSGNITNFDGATFNGENTSFWGATFSGASTHFERATFSGTNTHFDEATFRGENISFDGVTFNGEKTSFLTAYFGAGKVAFTNPKAWDPPPVFDWDVLPPKGRTVAKPGNVKPDDWPPKPANSD